MAFTYSDWRSQTTTSARLTRLRLHMAEIEDAIEGRNIQVGADGKSLAREALLGLLDRLTEQEAALEAAVGNAGGRSWVKLTNPNN